MNAAMGEPSTNVVSTLTGRPSAAGTVATLVSALVACM